MRERVIEQIEREKIIAIIRGVQKEKLPFVAEALYQGGIRVMEITYTTDKSVADEETAERIANTVALFGDTACIGAGTVTTETQVELTYKAGGKFIISPDTYKPVIRRTRALGLVSIPGAITPSEAMTAVRAGADFVKLFPIAKLGGAPYVKAITAPLSGVKFLAVGGINEKNMSEYLRAGIKGFGVGANIVDMKLVETGDYAGITALAKVHISALQ